MRILPNGQWTLQKNDEVEKQPSIHSLMGKTHTVEVHPHIDHLYKLKHEINASPTRSRNIGEIKKTHPALADSLPRDAKGKVTPEMIDKHIAGLPKHKVEVKVVPYTMNMQQHRGNAQQYVVSAGFHPETLKNLSPGEKGMWGLLKNQQHDLKGHDHQIGWARIDPWTVKSEPDEPGGDNSFVPNDGHWHIDEIQSDFGVPDRLKSKMDMFTHPQQVYRDIHSSDIPKEHPELAKLNDESNKFEDERMNALYNLNVNRTKLSPYDFDKQHSEITNKYDELTQPYKEAVEEKARKIIEERKKLAIPSPKDFIKMLSHGHDDPMHMIHSAVNQLGRQHGIESMSMDMPNHQAHQSGLRPINASEEFDPVDEITNHIMNGGVSKEDVKKFWDENKAHVLNAHQGDIDFKSAMGKLGEAGLEEFANLVPTDSSSWIFNGSNDNAWDEVLAPEENYTKLSPEVRKTLLGMSPRERDALSRAANDYSLRVHNELADQLGIHEDSEGFGDDPDEAEYDLPVHQINTYDKRPKKLGFSPIDKAAIMGNHEYDQYKQVQFNRLHKNLIQIRALLKKISHD